MCYTSLRFPPSLQALFCHCGIYPNPVSGTGQALVIPAKSLSRIGIGAGIHLTRWASFVSYHHFVRLRVCEEIAILMDTPGKIERIYADEVSHGW